MAQTASRDSAHVSQPAREEPARIAQERLAAAVRDPDRRELADAVKRYWKRVRASGFGRH